MYNFGLGSLTLMPSGANPTPIQVGVLKDVSFDISFDQKELRGSWSFPLDVARAAGKIGGKIKSANLRGDLIAAVLGMSSASGSVIGIVGETAAIPTTPFQITVANGANFKEDLGVVDLTTGKSMARGATASATGVYSLNAATGVYTFNTADTAHNVAITYSYTSTGGKTITLSNSIMGSNNVSYGLRCHSSYKANTASAASPFGVNFYAVILPKLSFALKAEDYSEQDLEFTAVADPSTGKVFDWYVGE